MKKFTFLFTRVVCLGFIGLMLITTGCSDNPAQPQNTNSVPDTFIKITSYSGNQYQFTVYALDSLKTGHNKIYIAVKDGNGNAISIKNPDVTPIMHMESMMHSAPVSAAKTVPKNGVPYLKTSVYFIMPSMGSSYWTLNVKGQTNGGETLEEKIRVAVAGSGLHFSKKVNNTTYYLSYVAPKTPVMGGDTYEVAIHYMKDMMHFPAVAGATVKIKPYMDMGGGHGHGPASVDAIADEVRPGHYKGAINYSMAGQWQLSFTATLDDGTEISFPTFKIMVKQ